MDTENYPIIGGSAPMGPFQQITAVSQSSIIANFAYDFDSGVYPNTCNASTGAPGSPDTSLTAQMGYPAVQLVGTAGGTQLNFTLNFLSGT